MASPRKKGDVYRRRKNRKVGLLSCLVRQVKRPLREILAPIVNEEKRANRLLIRKTESIEQRMNSTEQALEKFAAAITEYAQHLASHTSAIQGLAEASHELKRSAAEQNKIISYLVNSLKPRLNIEELASRLETVPEPEMPAPKVKKRAHKAIKPAPETARKQFTPGCARHKPLTAEEKRHHKSLIIKDYV